MDCGEDLPPSEYDSCRARACSRCIALRVERNLATRCAICAGPVPMGRRAGKPRRVCDDPACRVAFVRQLPRTKWKVPRKPVGHDNFTWDGWTDRGRHWAIHEVTDDYGTQQRLRRCVSCRRWLPEGYDHFATKKTDGPRVVLWENVCRPCKVAENKAWRDRRTPEEKTTAGQRRWQAIKADPERFARQQYYSMAWRERDPEHVRSLHRVTQRNRLRRLREDPERWEQYLAERRRRARELAAERCRRDEQLAAERAALDEEDRAIAATPLTAGPLGCALKRWMQRRQITARTAAAVLEVSERLLANWIDGSQPVVEFGRADEVLLATDLLWFEVWEPGCDGYPVAQEMFEGGGE
jgi:hypothetical protein